MSFTKRLRQVMGGEDPRAADVQREAAEELRRARGPASGPGGGGPSSAPGAAARPSAGPPPAPGPPGSGPPSAPGPSGSGPPRAPGPSSPSPSPAPESGSGGPEVSPPPEAPAGPSAGPGGSGGPGGGAAPPFAAPSSGEPATPEEERQALNEMALEDLGGPAAAGGGLQVDPAEAEAMRDRALAQYLQRKEEFDRFREREARRSGGERAQPQQAAAPSQRSQPQPAQPQQPEEDPELDELQQRLGDLPGLTRTKMEALLNEFDSVEALEQAGEDEIFQVDGIGQRLAGKIVRALSG